MPDLIERDAVIWITAETGALETQRRVKELPAVEAEPVRHAHWTNDTFCSDCKRFPVDVSVSISNQELTKHFSRCPHCGARMDGGDGSACN